MSDFLPREIEFDKQFVEKVCVQKANSVALNLGGQATAGGALQLPFPSL